MFAMFYAHARLARAHITLMTFTQFAQNALYGSTLGHGSYTILLFSALFLAQQWYTLKSLLFSVHHCRGALDFRTYYAKIS